MFILKDFQARIKRLFLILFIALCLMGAILSYYNSPIEIFQKKEIQALKKEAVALKISDMAFSSPDVFSSDESFPDFSTKLKVFLHEPRPDSEIKDNTLEVSLFSDNKSRKISSHEKLYLTYDNGYKFSDSPTSCWLDIDYTPPDIAKISACASFNDPNNNLSTTEKFFEITASEKELKDLEMKEDEGFLSLKNAIFLGPDLFLDLCEKDKETPRLNRLIFPSNQIFFVKKGDFLIFKEGKWQVPENIDTKDYSLSRITSINQGILEIDYWKKGEIGRIKIKLIKPSQGNALHINDDFISDLSIRTKKQVSCKIQGQRMVINEKDFLYKKGGIWKKGSLSELENKEDLSEFFLFEKLELTPAVKNFIGYVFNQDKTQMVKVEKKIVKKLAEAQPDKGSNNIRQPKKRR